MAQNRITVCVTHQAALADLGSSVVSGCFRCAGLNFSLQRFPWELIKKPKRGDQLGYLLLGWCNRQTSNSQGLSTANFISSSSNIPHGLAGAPPLQNKGRNQARSPYGTAPPAPASESVELRKEEGAGGTLTFNFFTPEVPHQTHLP